MSGQSSVVGWRILVGASLLICAVTLAPFNFQFAKISLAAIASFLSYAGDAWDLSGNVLLFLPFGFGLAAVLKGKRGSLAIALLLSGLFSLAVETLQLGLLGRTPSWIDVGTNLVGGGLGSVVYSFWQLIGLRFSQVRQSVTVPTVVAALIGWVLLMGFLCLGLQRAALLSNWDLSFPLLVGNELTSDRPWNGKVSRVEISDRALSAMEVAEVLKAAPLPQPIAVYSLSGAGNYRDRTRHNPDLVWRGSPQAATDGAAVSDQRWLVTDQPVKALSKRLRQTSEFTIYVSAQTADLSQGGPGRILSISADSMHRNFTLGQLQDKLILRLRTPITGENGKLFGLLVPQVFRDRQWHQFVVCYEDNVLRFYIDRPDRVLVVPLTPEFTLLQRYFAPFEGILSQVPAFNLQLQRVLFRGVFFAPLGMLVALLLSMVQGQRRFYGLVLGLGMGIPAVLLELMLRKMSWNGALISLGIAIATLCLSKMGLSKQRDFPRQMD
jgi:glycopeptide antibiotics resistance protein